jgi:hypothetical protein
MKRRKSVFVFFIGLGVYLSLIKINLDSYTGLCIESFQSNRINRSYAIFGIDDNGKRKTVKVKLSNDELPIEGSRVIVSKRVMGLKENCRIQLIHLCICLPVKLTCF